jgi:2-polyprenyl-6-methoxyphenol hydroxylase-like FAD-dependent oxidoreductase
MQVPEDFGTTDVNIADMDAMRELLLGPEYFADTAEEVQQMIKHAEPFRRWPLYTLPMEALSWDSVPGVALVGDAAHVTIPNGDGVNCAMADALALVNKLSSHGLEGRDQAVRDYEKDMFVRSKASMKQGFRLWELMSHPDGPPALLKAFEDGFGS